MAFQNRFSVFSSILTSGSARRRRGILAIPAVLLLGCLNACGPSTEASDKNFTLALNTYYSDHDDCLFPSALRFPYEADLKTGGAAEAPAAQAGAAPSGPNIRGLDALAKAGLLEMVEEKSLGVKHYSLTAFGARTGSRFCYGHRVVTEIENFTPPAAIAGKTVSRVNYGYRLMDLPPWADSDEMKSAFPALAKATSSHPEGSDTLELTRNGWMLPEPD